METYIVAIPDRTSKETLRTIIVSANKNRDKKDINIYPVSEKSIKRIYDCLMNSGVFIDSTYSLCDNSFFDIVRSLKNQGHLIKEFETKDDMIINVLGEVIRDGFVNALMKVIWKLNILLEHI